MPYDTNTPSPAGVEDVKEKLALFQGHKVIQLLFGQVYIVSQPSGESFDMSGPFVGMCCHNTADVAKLEDPSICDPAKCRGEILGSEHGKVVSAYSFESDSITGFMELKNVKSM